MLTIVVWPTRRIVAGAATIAEAKYAALGIYNESGAIESFIHHGMDDDTMEWTVTPRHSSGAFPTGMAATSRTAHTSWAASASTTTRA